MGIIEEHIKELTRLCEKYHVSKLYVFGSMVKGDYSDNSDIDFLVQFSAVDPYEYFDNFLEFKTKLEELYARNVDLVEIQTLKNPILKKSIDRDKVMLYGRTDSKMAV